MLQNNGGENLNIYIQCAQCIKSNQLNSSNNQDFQFYKVPVNEEGVYNFICYRGHETTAISPYEKYQILFQMGANALLEGYYFESVGCFIASVERFREWTIKFIWYLNGINEKKSDDLWNKHFKNSSERQLGAFSAMFIDHFKEPPLIFDGKQSSFRNKVLHKGIIPTRDETYKFGEYVFGYLRSIQKTIYLKYEKESFEFSSKFMKRFNVFEKPKIISGETMIQNASEMILVMSYSVCRDTCFKDELEIIDKYRNVYKFQEMELF
ncbi:hypothetical protein [Bacillus sp. A260]|uniref:hypothetical protein n=1 Tax=Bacillus sp. A260 TaxID=2660750 RepID=UPI001317E499|nr:hypothetical protein [Bacillus sp. A260]QGY38567.1 hypothetical protein GD442_27455 [Bacillus sp. A260]